MADPAVDQDAVRGTTSILNWYDSTQPIHIDLVGDYAGKELFIVEGDSLLRECFEDERIDFDGGFQLLHAVYVVERFLENLIKRHCQFHIIFFEENAELCIPPGISQATRRSRYLLARSVVKRHLTLHLPKSFPSTIVKTFPALDCNDFDEYLGANPIHFVMIHDGSGRESRIVKPLDNESMPKQMDKSSKILLRGMIWWFNTHKLNVALLNSIEFRDSKVFTMIVESFTAPSKVKLAMTTKFIEQLKNTRELRKSSKEPDPTDEYVALDAEALKELEEAFSEDDLSENYFLAAYAVSKTLEDEGCDPFMASAFILHTIILKHIPLSQRRLPLVTFDEKFEKQLDSYLSQISHILRHTIEDPKWGKLMEGEEVQTDAIDIVDGRLFRIVIQAMCDNAFKGAMPSATQPDWKVLRVIVARLCQEEISLKGSTDPEFSETTAKEDDFEHDTENLAVLPFSNKVFDKHLECIHVEADTSIAARMGAMKLYRETTHWHNHRKPLNPKYAPAPKVTKWKNPLRMNQFYMKEMTLYAASLTGATGKALEPETVVVGPKNLMNIAEDRNDEPKKSAAQTKKEELAEAKAKKGAGKKGTKAAASGLTKAQQMIAENKERKGGKEDDKAFTAWTTVMKGFEIISDDQDRYLKTKAYRDNLDSAKKAALEADINTFILQSLLTWWARYCKDGKKEEGYHVVALIWNTIRSLCTSKAPVSKETIQHMTKICTLLGIPDSMNSFKPTPTDRKLSFVFKYPATQSLRIDFSQSEFQLNYCGPYMDRMLDARPDARVSNFIPDGWQRDVLDQIDAKKSVFVVAPTSAGKTFISFYAMEQVLRADNDGVLVYVAPTKALVNQIAAEVQGRFSKRFTVPGKGVWAIHTRDYRVNNSTGCQILVTVPHILQIMLLSPSNAKSWAPRVRRIIFDEIHSIGQAEDGVVWEQLLLLAPCPIVALSATVGNPEQFNDWLTETQKASGSDLKMIQHSTRYSDLRKYMYEPPKTFKFSGLGKSHGVGLGLDGLRGFETFHPMASLVDKSRGMPDDLALEPRDCLSLWRAMIKFQTDKYKVPESLNPAKALPPCIAKIDIFAWEKALKKTLVQWMAHRDSPFDKVIQYLTPAEVQPVQEVPSSANSSVTEGDAIDNLDLKATSLPLLYQLHQRRALPAILFNYDRNQCEQIAYSILSQLVEAENKWKEGPRWKKLMEGYEKYKETKDKKSKKLPKPAKKGKEQDDEGGSKDDRAREDASEGASDFDLFDPEAPQADFSFANSKQLPKAELDEFVHTLRWKHIPEELVQLLQRGIGVHHAGMNRKYRQCVEMLFRKGFLRVVVATGTLSLGINMPCATVVFSGDSVFLTALQFRQAAGRSGRRGFDLLGNVVFQGIPRERASRLLSSKLPDMTGHFPITTTLVLRLFTLLNDSKQSSYAVKAINSLLEQPRLYLGGQSFKEQVLHHLRFSIEYLRRNELLGPGGEPVNFTSCVSHLYFTENSSFAFHALLRGGYFHTLCADIDTKPEKILREMLLVLSHLFGRRTVRQIDDLEEAEAIKNSPSMVYLPPMPEEAANILRGHNKNTLDIFSTYVKTFAEQHVREEEQYLPLTHTPIGLAPPYVNGKSVDGQVNGNRTETQLPKKAAFEFLPSLPTPHARSAFVALSGQGDHFSTIDDLCSSTREGVFLESAVIPHLELHPDETRAPLNAYLLDFFLHGSLQPLARANGIRRSDVWFILNDFSLVLATIVTSLALHLGLGSNEDPEMLDVMGSGDIAENDEDEQAAATAITETTSTTSGTNTKAAPVPFVQKKSKKVVDDWDAGEDALVAEEDYLKKEAENEDGVTDDEEYEKLMNVYKAFRKLKTEFDAKFLVIWA